VAAYWAGNLTESRDNFRFHYAVLARVLFHYAPPLASFFACSPHFQLSAVNIRLLATPAECALMQKRGGVHPDERYESKSKMSG
jgi:hypothetical protein